MGDKRKSGLIVPGDDAVQEEVDRTVPEDARVYGVRVVEWSEWVPLFGDEATKNQLRFAQGVTFMQADKREKLADIAVTSAGQKIERWVVMDGEGNQTVLEQDAAEPSEEDQRSGKAVKGVFGLYAFQAIMVSEVETDQMPKPIVVSELPQPKPQVHTAAAMPPMPNRKQRRSKR